MARGPGLRIDIAELRFPGAEAPLFGDFHLEIAPGSVVALHGPSGVGKSTLLRLIAGVERRYTGNITVDGVPVHRAPPPGFVFQDSRLLPWLTARDNIRAIDPAMSAQTADAALASVGLADVSDAYPNALSGGMQRRVALARALATNPRYLLLDEPFVSLDGKLVDDMHQLMGELIGRSGATVIFASHQASDAARLAGRVVTLRGRPVRVEDDQVAVNAPASDRRPQ